MPVPKPGLRRFAFAGPVLALALFSFFSFAARADQAASRAPWRDYQILMWQPQTRREYAALKVIGVTGGEVHLVDRNRPGELPLRAMAPLRANHMHWYVENIATDFYSAYHRWFPDRPVDWRFRAAKALYRKDPHDIHAFWREPSLSDPKWLATIRSRLRRVVQAQQPYDPLFYNLGDETGIGDLSIFWDFDFSPSSLAGMRLWLKTEYPSLAALNREWGSHFADWSAVMPMTTQEAMARKDENYAPWADFKAWMDVAFARALRAGTDAVHAADPRARAAIEGAQIPGWGGYDYTRLAQAVDVMEVYDGGGNLEIARSLNPKLVLLTTAVGGGPREAHDVWREALRGTRGVILWDPNHEFVGRRGALGARGLDDRAVFRQLRSGIGALLINSEREFDPVGILYSPASMRTQWMLDWRARGDAWARRDIKDSYEDASAVRDAMMAYSRALERTGLHPRFLSPELIERGALRRHAFRVLIMPRVLALSPKAAAQIRAFVRAGGTVIADTEPGVFDAHSRKLAKPLLADLFQRPEDGKAGKRGSRGRAVIEAAPRAGDCVSGVEQSGCRAFGALLAAQAVKPSIGLHRPGGQALHDLDSYRFRDGAVRLLAIQRAWAEAIPGRQRKPSDQPSEAAVVTLPQAAFAYDVLNGRSLGYGRRFELTLGPTAPAILAYSTARLPKPTIAGPSALRRGESGLFTAGFAGRFVLSRAVLHCDVIDPAGHVIGADARNLVADDKGGFHPFPLALNGLPGEWRIRVSDPVTGQSATYAVRLGD